MRRKVLGSLLSIVGMLTLILDTKTAISGVSDGISICIKTIIPSLFPFMVVSKLLTSNLSGSKLPFLRPLSRMCAVPDGCESILAISFAGGYPIGAHLIGDAYKKEQLDYDTASRMLCFCNNAGPSFIFGLSAFLFDRMWIGWCIWGTQIVSALIVSFILPGKYCKGYRRNSGKTVSFVNALESSVKSISLICGWVIIFRMIITYLTAWLHSFSYPILKVILFGLLELSNGCLLVETIPSFAIRFALINGMLSFGGICVFMQTRSAAPGLSMRKYLAGKFLHSSISVFISFVIQVFLFPDEQIERCMLFILISFVAVILQSLYQNRKIIVASSQKVLYN